MAAVATALLTHTDIGVDHVPVPASGGYVHVWLLGAGLAAAGMAIVLVSVRAPSRLFRGRG
jgi:hypothetical protein